MALKCYEIQKIENPRGHLQHKAVDRGPDCAWFLLYWPLARGLAYSNRGMIAMFQRN